MFLMYWNQSNPTLFLLSQIPSGFLHLNFAFQILWDSISKDWKLFSQKLSFEFESQICRWTKAESSGLWTGWEYTDTSACWEYSKAKFGRVKSVILSKKRPIKQNIQVLYYKCQTFCSFNQKYPHLPFDQVLLINFQYVNLFGKPTLEPNEAMFNFFKNFF